MKSCVRAFLLHYCQPLQMITRILLVGMFLRLANWNRTKTECLDICLDAEAIGCQFLAKSLILFGGEYHGHP